MLDLGVLTSLLRQINEDERSERHNFAHDGRVAFIDAAPALIAELRELRADEKMHVEVIGDLMAETTTLKAEIEKLREANRWRPIAEAYAND
jgi:hypothetical protein